MLRGSERLLPLFSRTSRHGEAEDFGYGEHVVVVIEVPPAAVVLHEQVEPVLLFRRVGYKNDGSLSGDAPVVHSPVAAGFAGNQFMIRVRREGGERVLPDELEFFPFFRAMEVQMECSVSGTLEAEIQRYDVGFPAVEQGEMTGVRAAQGFVDPDGIAPFTVFSSHDASSGKVFVHNRVDMDLRGVEYRHCKVVNTGDEGKFGTAEYDPVQVL